MRHAFSELFSTFLLLPVFIHAADIQTTRGYNPWWKCPDCGSQYREDDYRRHRATAHADRYTPETRRQLLGIPKPPIEPPPAPTVIIVEPPRTEEPPRQEMAVTFTPHAETATQRTGDKLNGRIAQEDISLSTVKSILEEAKLSVEQATPKELRICKHDDAGNFVRAEHRAHRNQFIFTKLYSVRKGTEEVEMLRLANRLNFLNKMDVHCTIDELGNDNYVLYMYSIVPLREGVTKQELTEGYEHMNRATAIVRAVDKQRILIPMRD